jgi:pSer/pThr/pTyr-binding forkhead associated (FHA) protein
MAWQFLVVEGADKDKVFRLPENGLVIVGSSQKHAEICLHDLFVQRTHCEIEISPDNEVVVRNLRPTEGILVNKVRTEDQQLKLGDVLRVGNSYLRLEPAGTAPPPDSKEETPSAPPPQAETKAEPSGPLPALPPERLSELAGRQLGRYQLKEVLSKNGHAVDFLAIDQKSQETLALKVLDPQFPAGPEEMLQFIEVMRKALHLQHDSLAGLRGVGKTGPYTWIAREHVPGESLASVLERIVSEKKKPKWQSGLRLAVQIGGALDYLHRLHVMHGQLVPRNILINTEAKQARLANLMLDQALSGSQLHAVLERERRAQDVPFFSPEQCEKGAFIDELSDQYALGALVYARMTGRPPFVAATPEATMKQIRTAALVRPRQLNPNIPEEVEVVVVRMLARRQEDRYSSPAALLADLERLRPSAAQREQQ